MSEQQVNNPAEILYQLTLSESQIRTIFACLAVQPYQNVAQIIQSIDAQTTMQQKASLEAEKGAKE